MNAAGSGMRGDPHLRRLEAESIHVLREAVAQCVAPVLLYSIGKDSTVLLHLARKAFFPARLPFPLLHIDTGWKFRDMLTFRDASMARLGLDLIVHRNETDAREAPSPFADAAFYTWTMKTLALREALTTNGFDAAFGGARRDEERSRAKERIYSVRGAGHAWDPKRQRPEFWKLFNGQLARGESVRVFPLSNWTELDIWQYILAEHLAVVPLYFAADRPVVERDGNLIVVDDDRLPLHPSEAPVTRRVRFRSLGCYPLTAAHPSDATTVEAIIAEVASERNSERGGRLIDRDERDSMEKKKREGYF